MKNLFLFLVILGLTLSVNSNSFSQDNPFVQRSDIPISIDEVGINNNTDGNGRALVNVIVGNNSTSSNARAPQGSRLFANSKTIVTGTEMTTSGFSGVVSSIGWRWNVPFPPAAAAPRSQTIATTGNIRVYMKDTIGSATAVGGTFIDTNGVGYTKVVDGTISIPTGLAEINIDIPAGGPGTAPYTPTPGNGVLYIVVYKTITAVSGLDAGIFPPVVFCTNLGGTQIVYQSTTVPGAIGAASAFRPETRFGTSAIDILQLANIYALGRVPTPWGCPDTLCYRLKRVIIDPRPVTLRIRIINVDPNQGNVKFDSIFQYIHPNSNPFDTLLTFVRPWNITNWKVDSLIVEAVPYPNETAIANNTHTWRQRVTCNAWNWTEADRPLDGGVGFNGGTGNFVSCFRNTCPIPVPIWAVDLSFFNLAGAGNQPYQVKIYGDNNGVPGPLLYTSAPQVSPPGNATPPQRVQHLLPQPVNVPANSRFYVGYAQTGAVFLSVGRQTETPVKAGRFLFSSPVTNDTTWTDFAGVVNVRLDVCPLTTTNINLKAYLEGFYNGAVMVPDTVTLEARSQTSPYPVVDISDALLNSNGLGTFAYCRLECDVPYWLVVRHRNHIRTWSNGPVTYDCDLPYDFTTSANQAFGSNLVFIPPPPLIDGVGGGFGIYTSDVNQDGVADVTDCSMIDNDAFNFVSGYVDTDVNGDQIVDLADLSLCENNSAQFVAEVAP